MIMDIGKNREKMGALEGKKKWMIVLFKWDLIFFCVLRTILSFLIKYPFYLML